MNKQPDWTWPDGKRIAVVLNVCLEAWSDRKAPPDTWVGTRSQIADRGLSMAYAR
jgi:hypothetical protein